MTGLDWSDPQACAAWLAALADAAEDALAVAADQVAPIATRHLGRSEARRILGESRASMRDALAFAARGLPGHEPPPPASGPRWHATKR